MPSSSTAPPALRGKRKCPAVRCITPPLPPVTCQPGQVEINGVCEDRLTVCPVGQEVNPMTNRCQPITCPTGQVLMGSTCEDPPPPPPPHRACAPASRSCWGKTVFPPWAKTLPTAATSLTFWQGRPEFRNQPALRDVKAHYAYGSNRTGGYYGGNVAIAVLDDGIPEQPGFQNGVDTNGDAVYRLERVYAINYIGPKAYGSNTFFVGDDMLTTNEIALNDTAMGCTERGVTPSPLNNCDDHGTPVAWAAAANGLSLGSRPMCWCTTSPTRNSRRTTAPGPEPKAAARPPPRSNRM